MRVNFDISTKVQSVDNIRRMPTSQQRKTFVYSKRKSDLNFDDMYEDLNANIAQLVEENRIKLVSMNSARSKDLVNKTQSKLISFMKSKPGTKKTFALSSTDRVHKLNIYAKQDENKQNHQQIFDMNKLEQIIRNFQRNTVKQSPRFSGALAQKVLKLTDRISYKRPFTHRTLNAESTQTTQTSKNYLGWKSQKSKRRLKHMFV